MVPWRSWRVVRGAAARMRGRSIHAARGLDAGGWGAAVAREEPQRPPVSLLPST
ncbi:hypothetical protein JYU34_021063 [Plutella xylostella]|uniref:Uncharacterized protein n=1 Tax=Plutella xylostella TaxID=51655 RepID=A0ABQ7PSM3_PLUXY|nr:hypothetical protein JYU34_021063 [Plutella xylostella]